VTAFGVLIDNRFEVLERLVGRTTQVSGQMSSGARFEMKTPEHTVFAMTAEPTSARLYFRSAMRKNQDAATTKATPTMAVANSQGQILRDDIVEASFAGIE